MHGIIWQSVMNSRLRENAEDGFARQLKCAGHRDLKDYLKNFAYKPNAMIPL